MARRKLDERNITRLPAPEVPPGTQGEPLRTGADDGGQGKLSKTGAGRSISVTLPIEMVRNLKWREHQKVVIQQKGKKLIIEDWPIR